MKEQINIYAENDFRAFVDEGWARKIVRQVLRAERVPSPCEVSVVFTDAETVQSLNRDYRGVDESTDVLAFYTLPQKGPDSYFVLPPDGITHLGDVVICYPQAVAQAEEQGHSLERELALLVIHGILHLLAYDHEEPEEGKKMREREQQLLEKYSRKQ